MDLRRIAAEKEIDLQSAISNYAWQDDLAILLTDLGERYPNYSGAEVVDPAAREVKVWFKSKIQPEAKQILDGVDYAAISVVDGLEFSSEDLDSQVERIHAEVADLPGLVETAIASYDVETAQLDIEVRPLAGVDVTSGNLEKALSPIIGPDLVARANFTINPRLSGSDDEAAGGGKIERLGQSVLHCTGGFTARASSGLTGVTTAGHCQADYESNNNVSYENEDGEYEQSLGFKLQHKSDYGDMQFSTVSTTEVDDFYFDFGGRRDVSAVANPMVNQTVCRFGLNTGAQCGTVYDLSICKELETGETVCRLVRMDNDEAEGGDSGGPWFYGGTAYGIHQGSVYSYIGTDDVWTRVTYFEEALGVTVMK